MRPQGRRVKVTDPLQAERRKFWCDAWIATANSSTCVKPSVATNWADCALAEFDRRNKGGWA